MPRHSSSAPLSVYLPLLLLLLPLLLLGHTSAQSDTIWDTAVSLPELSTYVSALKLCPQLLKDAKDPDVSYTFFAPNNKAFTTYFKKVNTTLKAFLKKPALQLQRLLEYHVGSDAYMMSIAMTPKKTKMTTLLPNATLTLQLVKTKYMVNQAAIVEPDFPGGNSYLQVISAVLTPPAAAAGKALHRRLLTI